MVTDETEVDERERLIYSLELPMYHKWHMSMSTDLTDRDKVFERNLLGLNLRDVDRIYSATGCRRLEEYLVRQSLNDQVFSGLIEESLYGHNYKSMNLISQLRNMVKDLTILHRVSFLMR